MRAPRQSGSTSLGSLSFSLRCGLILVLVLVVVLVPVIVVPATASTPTTRAERRLRDCANRLRRQHGLSPLRYDSALNAAAHRYARQMARQGFFDHVDPYGNGPQERVDAIAPGRWLVGENIAAGYRSTDAACRGWYRSSGHRRNILDPDYTSIGAGFARGGPYHTYFVQDFGIPAE